MKFILTGLILFCICLGGCRGDRVLPIDFNKSFEEILLDSYNNKKPFCIVLIDSMQMSHQNYVESLNRDYGHLRSEAIYDIIDVNHQENAWYAKWLKPSRLPLTCVFSSNAILIDIIPGATRETFLYTEKAIKTQTPTEFHWPNQFGANKKTIIPFLNNVLDSRKLLNQGIFMPSTFDQLPDSLKYPYSLYLRLAGELLQKDSLASRETAKSLLALETPQAMELYKDEFITAKNVLYPDFNIDTEPNIRVDSTVISFSDCVVDETITIDIPVYNDGEHPLTISKIYLSCSCLEHAADNEGISIPAKGSGMVKFYFTPENEGNISRDIFIASNAVNMPILHINILAKAINANN
jgi:hypothetical protein